MTESTPDEETVLTKIITLENIHFSSFLNDNKDIFFSKLKTKFKLLYKNNVINVVFIKITLDSHS